MSTRILRDYQVTYTDASREPQIGDISRGYTLGKKGHSLLIWRVCIDCKKGSWVTATYKNKPHSIRCISCSNKHKSISVRANNPTPKGTLENPIVGDVRYSDEINNKSKSGRFIYVECPECFKRRWVNIYQHKKSIQIGKSDLCVGCELISESRRLRHAGVNHPSWRGGFQYSCGYRMVYVTKDSPYAKMISTRMYNGAGYVREHRLVVAQHLGRCLETWEVVHHKNHIRDDNRMENLELMIQKKHHVFTILENRISNLEAKVRSQSQIINLLLWYNKENKESSIEIR